jgi:hypothetical protein
VREGGAQARGAGLIACGGGATTEKVQSRKLLCAWRGGVWLRAWRARALASKAGAGRRRAGRSARCAPRLHARRTARSSAPDACAAGCLHLCIIYNKHKRAKCVVCVCVCVCLPPRRPNSTRARASAAASTRALRPAAPRARSRAGSVVLQQCGRHIGFECHGRLRRSCCCCCCRSPSHTARRLGLGGARPAVHHLDGHGDAHAHCARGDTSAACHAAPRRASRAQSSRRAAAARVAARCARL